MFYWNGSFVFSLENKTFVCVGKKLLAHTNKNIPTNKAGKEKIITFHLFRQTNINNVNNTTCFQKILTVQANKNLLLSYESLLSDRYWQINLRTQK